MQAQCHTKPPGIMRVPLADVEHQQAQPRKSLQGDLDDEWNEALWEAEQDNLEFNSIVKMIGEECLQSFAAGPTRVPMRRCLFNCINLLGLIIFKAVLYFYILHAPADPRAAFIHHLQNVMPLVGAFMPIVLVLDSDLFQSARVACGLIYLLMSLSGILLIVCQFLTWTATYLCAPAFVDAMANLVHGALLLIFKSRWPFRKRRNV